MATVEGYQTKAGKRYRVRYRTPENKSTSERGFRTKKDAELRKAKIELDIARGDFVPMSAGRITVADLASEWLEKKRALKPSAFTVLEIAWRVYVEPKWGSTPINKIKPSSVESWISAMSTGNAPTKHASDKEAAKPKSATTVLRALGVLAGILDDAVKDGRITKNPARGAENLPTKESVKTRRYLSHEEVARLAGAAPDDAHATFILTLVYTGLRWGEATALRVRDVDLGRLRVQVARSATTVQRVIHVGTPKSWEQRSVPFPAFLSGDLERLCEEKAADDLIFADAETGSFFAMPDLRSDRNGWWIVTLRDAGIARLTPHDLRHTCASLAVSAGANVKALQRMLGHKSAAMTLDIYADLFDDDLDQVATALHQQRVSVVVSNSCPPEAAAA